MMTVSDAKETLNAFLDYTIDCDTGDEPIQVREAVALQVLLEYVHLLEEEL